MTLDRRIGAVPVALLAGGLATRLYPISRDTPKAMVEVAGRPFVDHQLELLRRNGIRRVVVCLGYRGEQVEGYLGDGSSRGMELRYSYDGPRLLGTGGALRRAAPLLGDPFWVLYGDSYTEINFRSVLDAFLASDAPALMTIFRNVNRWDRSNVLFRDGRLLRYDKSSHDPQMAHIDYGVALLRQEVLDRIPAEQPFDVADLYRALVEENRMIGYEVTHRFYEIGSLDGLAETRAHFERQQA